MRDETTALRHKHKRDKPRRQMCTAEFRSAARQQSKQAGRCFGLIKREIIAQGGRHKPNNSAALEANNSASRHGGRRLE
jgi:hypothetical protein